MKDSRRSFVKGRNHRSILGGLRLEASRLQFGTLFLPNETRSCREDRNIEVDWQGGVLTWETLALMGYDTRLKQRIANGNVLWEHTISISSELQFVCGWTCTGANAVISTAAFSFMNAGIDVVGIKHGYSNLIDYSADKPLVEGKDYITFNHVNASSFSNFAKGS